MLFAMKSMVNRGQKTTTRRTSQEGVRFNFKRTAFRNHRFAGLGATDAASHEQLGFLSLPRVVGGPRRITCTVSKSRQLSTETRPFYLVGVLSAVQNVHEKLATIPPE